MAKKSRQRKRKSAAQASRRRGLLLGGAVLGVVVCVGAFLMYNRRQSVAVQLQGTVDNHYTKGTAGASVVIKEFSDYA
jgi:hypothetical protein